VLGIEVALLPAAELGVAYRVEVEMAIAKRMDKNRIFMGDLQSRLM
jgi:hypothetical protein